MSRIKTLPVLTLFVLICFIIPVFGNNLQISTVTYDEVNKALNFDISWDNAFYINSDWNDHIYIFAKYKNANGGSWERVMFEPTGHAEYAALMIFSIAPSSLLLDGKRLGMKAGHSPAFTSGTQSANCTAL